MRHTIGGKAAFFIGLLSFFSLSSLAAPVMAAPPVPPPTDAGSILRDQQPNRLLQPPQLPTPEKAKEQPVKPEQGVLIAVKGFTFSGYEGVATEAELQALVADAKGKTITFGELTALVDKISAYFREKGWFLARAYLPKQDVTSGIIQITLLQGASDGHLEFKMDKTARILPGVLRGIGEQAIVKGQPINEHDLERAILLMNDLPGVTAHASLAPGTLPGTTGVEVAVSEGSLFSGTLFGDNQGNRYTGTWRANTTISINDPFSRGDQISGLLDEARGLAQGRIGYSIPLLFPGVRASLAYTGMRYELGEELSSLNYKGSSSSVDAGLSYSLLRSRTSSLNTSLTYGYKVLNDTQPGVDLSNKQINSVVWSVSGNSNDRFWNGGATSYSLGVTTGNLHESIAPKTNTGTAGAFTHCNAGLARLQQLAGGVVLNVSGIAQEAFNNLDSSEKFTLGGPTAVRAYPVGEASGDIGQLMSADIRYTVPVPAAWGNLQVMSFYDAGHITLNKDRYAGDVTNDTHRNDYWLQGAGVGLNYVFSARGALRASWAHVLGSNPGQRVGNNADGRDDKSRFWLQSELYF